MENKRLGVYIQHNELRVVEIERYSSAYRVTTIYEASFPNTLPFSINKINQQNYDDNFGIIIDGLEAALGAKHFKSTVTSIALDARSSFINTFPLKKNMADEEIKKIVNWELEQYFPGIDPELFLTNLYFPPQSSTAHNTIDCIHISVLKNYIHLLQKAVQSLGLSLISINVDIFSIGYLLKYFKPKGRKEPFFTIFFHKDDVLYCAILWHSKLIKYREFPVVKKLFPREKMLSFLESSSVLSKNISLRVFYHTINDMEEFDQTLNENIVLEELDPFLNQKLSLRVRRTIKKGAYDRSSFAPAVGAALSGLV